MKITKQFLKKIIVETIKQSEAPSVINDGGQFMEFEEYMDFLESRGLPRDPQVYLQKIGNLANMSPEEVEKLDMEPYRWKEKNDSLIAKEIAKAKKLLPKQATPEPQKKDKKGLFGLGFLGLEEQKNKGENKMKITREYLRRVIKEELERSLNEREIIAGSSVQIDEPVESLSGTPIQPGSYILKRSWDKMPGHFGLYTKFNQHVGDLSSQELQKHTILPPGM